MVDNPAPYGEIPVLVPQGGITTQFIKDFAYAHCKDQVDPILKSCMTLKTFDPHDSKAIKVMAFPMFDPLKILVRAILVQLIEPAMRTVIGYLTMYLGKNPDGGKYPSDLWNVDPRECINSINDDASDDPKILIKGDWNDWNENATFKQIYDADQIEQVKDSAYITTSATASSVAGNISAPSTTNATTSNVANDTAIPTDEGSRKISKGLGCKIRGHKMKMTEALEISTPYRTLKLFSIDKNVVAGNLRKLGLTLECHNEIYPRMTKEGLFAHDAFGGKN